MSDHEPTRATPDGVPILEGPDGLSELDNPMPRWMHLVFWGTFVWGVGYLIAYPGLGISVLGWTQKGMYDAEMAEAKLKYRPGQAADSGQALVTAFADPAAASRGAGVFTAQCAACHGQGGAGAIGPNLKDGTWRYGGTGAAIAETIAEGTPNGMPPFKASLSPAQLADLTAYVHGLGGGK